MPRPREFDEDDVVARATDLFWRRGYRATSVRDLGEALGLSASSLYRTFGDKHALFLRALDHYRATDSAEARAAARGCFVVNTATELGAEDPAVDGRTQAAFGVTRQALQEILQRGLRD